MLFVIILVFIPNVIASLRVSQKQDKKLGLQINAIINNIFSTI